MPKAQVVVGSLTQDVEVWYVGDCHLKVWFVATDQGTAVEWSKHAAPDDAQWKEIVETCKTLTKDEAFNAVMHYAVALASRIAQEGDRRMLAQQEKAEPAA